MNYSLKKTHPNNNNAHHLWLVHLAESLQVAKVKQVIVQIKLFSKHWQIIAFQKNESHVASDDNWSTNDSKYYHLAYKYIQNTSKHIQI